VLTTTVALAVAVCPAAFRAVIVYVVVAVIATDVEPLAATDVPVIVTDTALVVCHVTSATFADCSAAWSRGRRRGSGGRADRESHLARGRTVSQRLVVGTQNEEVSS
jgi:hypothetical protein